ncbi:MAG: hypothetical protein LBM13_01765 [Candidatus Ancillula sp.]|jgi:hypothetical protein|nr:hypothetical protein [Candidatus Ancillula sp.]
MSVAVEIDKEKEEESILPPKFQPASVPQKKVPKTDPTFSHETGKLHITPELRKILHLSRKPSSNEDVVKMDDETNVQLVRQPRVVSSQSILPKVDEKVDSLQDSTNVLPFPAAKTADLTEIVEAARSDENESFTITGIFNKKFGDLGVHPAKDARKNLKDIIGK